MELSGYNIKKFLIFQEVTFQAQKIKKIHNEKISYISRTGNLEKTSYIFSEESFSYILGNGNPEKMLYISGK